MNRNAIASNSAVQITPVTPAGSKKKKKSKTKGGAVPTKAVMLQRDGAALSRGSQKAAGIIADVANVAAHSKGRARGILSQAQKLNRQLQYARMIADPLGAEPVPRPDGLGGSSVAVVKQHHKTTLSPFTDAAGNGTYGVILAGNPRDNHLITGLLPSGAQLSLGDYVPYQGQLQEKSVFTAGTQTPDAGTPMIPELIDIGAGAKTFLVALHDGVGYVDGTAQTATPCALITSTKMQPATGDPVSPSGSNFGATGFIPMKSTNNADRLSCQYELSFHTVASGNNTITMTAEVFDSTGTLVGVVNSETDTISDTSCKLANLSFSGTDIGVPSVAIGNVVQITITSSTASNQCRFNKLEFQYKPVSGSNSLAVARHVNFPYSTWQAVSSHDFNSTIKNVTESCRCVASSLLLSDISPILNKSGTIAARVIDAGTGPGDANVGCYSDLADYPMAYNGGADKGLYGFVDYSSIKSRDFTSPDSSLDWRKPYLLLMTSYPSIGTMAIADTLLVTTVYEFKTNSQIFSTEMSYSDQLLLETVSNQCCEMGTITENPLHLKDIGNFLRGVGSKIYSGLEGALSMADKASSLVGRIASMAKFI